MARQSVITKKRKRGPAPTGVGTLIGVRMHDEQLAELDRWIAAQFTPMSRPEAIRVLVELGVAYGLPQVPVDKSKKKRR